METETERSRPKAGMLLWAGLFVVAVCFCWLPYCVFGILGGLLGAQWPFSISALIVWAGITAAIAVRRMRRLSASRAEFKSAFLERWQRDGLVEARAWCAAQKHSLARIVEAAIPLLDQRPSVALAMADRIAAVEIRRAHRGLGLLSTLVSLCVIVGVVGTISGMTVSYGNPVVVEPCSKACELALLISEALLSAAVCLGGGILVFALHGLLRIALHRRAKVLLANCKEVIWCLCRDTEANGSAPTPELVCGVHVLPWTAKRIESAKPIGATIHVPIICLFCGFVCFLLITANFNPDLAVIETGFSTGVEGDRRLDQQVPDAPHIRVLSNSLELHYQGVVFTEGFDDYVALIQALALLRQEHLGVTGFDYMKIYCDDTTKHAELIYIMDLCLDFGFTDLTVQSVDSPVLADAPHRLRLAAARNRAAKQAPSPR